MTEFAIRYEYFHCFIFIYTLIFIRLFSSYVCSGIFESNFPLSLSSLSFFSLSGGHVYKFKSACDKRINIDADEAKTRNTVTKRARRPTKNFPRVTLIPIWPTLRRTGAISNDYFSARVLAACYNLTLRNETRSWQCNFVNDLNESWVCFLVSWILHVKFQNLK